MPSKILIEIDRIPEVDPKFFNFKLKNSFQIQSVYHTDNKVVILGDLTLEEKQEILDLYTSVSTQNWSIDLEYMNQFIAEKYSINEEKGRKYKHYISGTLSNMVNAGIVTIEQAEIYGLGTKAVREHLNDGYWHSAYFAHVSFTPAQELQSLHDEIGLYIKDYVNTKYPESFKID